MKRLFLVLLVALAASVAVVSDAPAGDIADQPCPDASGPHTGVCPPGKVGVAYSIRFLLKEGSGCGPGKESWSVTSGNFPPGLTLASEGVVSGTPTQAGSFSFFVTVTHPLEPGCNGGFSDRRVTIVIAPETPKLVLGPEQAGVPISTVGAAFSLPMTSNLPDAKTWSIVGNLPPGLAINPTDGLISGAPTTAGTYTFTVQAVLASDPRSDTKTLSIVVRDPVAITGPKAPASEIGVPFELVLSAAGGTGVDTYVWTQIGDLPDGVEFAEGTISGTPESAGIFRFTVTATDAEGRATNYAGRVTVARELSLDTQSLRSGKVGRLYRARVTATGGVLPRKWKLTKGQLPRGIRFDKTLGVFAGTPSKAGRYRVTAELTDGLKVKVTKTFTIIVLAAPAPAKRR